MRSIYNRKPKRYTKKKNNKIYWGWKENSNNNCTRIIEKYLTNINIPVIKNNLSNICLEFNNLNDIIKELYQITRLKLTKNQIFNRIYNIRKKDGKERLFTKDNTRLIIDKLRLIDKEIIKHIYQNNMLGGSENETNNEEIKYKCKAELDGTKCNHEFTKKDSNYCRICGTKREDNHNTHSLCQCEDNVTIEFTFQEALVLSKISKQWNPTELVFMTLGNIPFLTPIGDIISLCLSIYRKDFTTSIILFLSILLIGLGYAIKFGYLAYDIHKIVKILQKKPVLQNTSGNMHP